VDTGHKEIERLLPAIKEKLSLLDREELLRRVANLEFERFLGDYRYADEPVLTVVEDDHRGRTGRREDSWKEGRGDRRSEGRGDRRSEGRSDGRSGDRPERRSEGRERQSENSGGRIEYTRIFINFGKKDGFFPEQLIEMINKNVEGKKVQLGKIDLMKKFSFFEVDSQYAAKVISSLEGTKYKGRKIGVEIAQEDPKPPREKGGGDRRLFKEKRYDKKRGRRD
jgi:ATP-dependent RNA helicase DeaD